MRPIFLNVVNVCKVSFQGIEYQARYRCSKNKSEKKEFYFIIFDILIRS